MLMYALITVAALTEPASGERPYGEASQVPEPRPAVYAPPPAAPYEPPSDFGRRAEGDDTAGLNRRPLTAPVGIEAYRRSYEYTPSDSEVGYEQGVAQARIDAQARMGGLDGVWRVTDADGHTLADLVVSDPGGTRAGEIAAVWNLGRTSDRGAAATARRDGEAVVIEAGLGARTARLRLTPTAQGWRGLLSRGGHEQAVTLIRPSEG